MPRSLAAWLMSVALGFLAAETSADDETPARSLCVMTFNLWHGGDAGGQPLDQSAEVIRRAGADVVGLQETRGQSEADPRPDRARELAALLGWHYADRPGSTGIISRHPLAAQAPGRLGATIELPDGPSVHIFNVHFAHAPYQPYQLLGIPYENGAFLATADEAVAAASEARGAEVDAVLQDIRPCLARGEIVFLTGDFNEPSWQDWTAEAHAAGRCPTPVAWPATSRVSAAGLVDSLRVLRPDSVAAPACTWTPITADDDPADRHDRIDFVFSNLNAGQVERVQVIGERADRADVVVAPYPSDHRAVAVRYRLPRTGSAGPEAAPRERDAD
ncbi:MAG: endonuclease/exonuclease/phosphatase family protein [Planctomyces sp.]|nr:endonuclease/exonuclease/phosphatase family protein [Planctomyces sp.]